MYTACTLDTADDGKPWCSTRVDRDGKDVILIIYHDILMNPKIMMRTKNSFLTAPKKYQILVSQILDISI